MKIFSGFQNTIWICFSSKIVISNSNWVNMSKYEKNHFFSAKKIRFSLKILKYVQNYWQNRFFHPISHINIKFHQNRSINKEFHFFRGPPLKPTFLGFTKFLQYHYIRNLLHGRNKWGGGWLPLNLLSRETFIS